MFGNPIAATDKTGNVLWLEHFQRFGAKRIQAGAPNSSTSNSDGNRIGFHMKEQDTESGLQYFGARYYDPTIGRFHGVDPVGVNEDDGPCFNRFNYAKNNPFKDTDPDGR